MAYGQGPRPHISYTSNRPPGIFTRIGAILMAAVLAVIGFMFSFVIFAVAIALGIVLWGFLWWKMRKVRKQMERDPRFQEFRRAAAKGGASPRDDENVIEGEVLREVREQDDRRSS